MRCHDYLSILLIRLLLFSNRIFFISFSSFLNVRLLKTYQISAFHLFRMSFPPHILVFSAKKPTKSSLLLISVGLFPAFTSHHALFTLKRPIKFIIATSSVGFVTHVSSLYHSKRPTKHTQYRFLVGISA